jgi:hypothetical protein
MIIHGVSLKDVTDHVFDGVSKTGIKGKGKVRLWVF